MLLIVSPEASLSSFRPVALCIVRLVCVMFVFKVSSFFCFTYFHLKRTSHSLSPLCAASLKTMPLLEAVFSISSWLQSYKLFRRTKRSASQNAHINLKNLHCAAPTIKSHINTVPLQIAGVTVVYNGMAQLAKKII